jgi:hypothetical protein
MGTFLFVWFLDESWDHSVWYYSIAAIVLPTIKNKPLMLIKVYLDVAWWFLTVNYN